MREVNEAADASQKENRPRHADDSLNGPIRTGRGTCHERALRFGRREAPIRCGFARTYVPDEKPTVLSRTTSPPSADNYRPPEDVAPPPGGKFLHTSVYPAPPWPSPADRA